MPLRSCPYCAGCRVTIITTIITIILGGFALSIHGAGRERGRRSVEDWGLAVAIGNCNNNNNPSLSCEDQDFSGLVLSLN